MFICYLCWVPVPRYIYPQIIGKPNEEQCTLFILLRTEDKTTVLGIRADFGVHSDLMGTHALSCCFWQLSYYFFHLQITCDVKGPGPCYSPWLLSQPTLVPQRCCWWPLGSVPPCAEYEWGQRTSLLPVIFIQRDNTALFC